MSTTACDDQLTVHPDDVIPAKHYSLAEAIKSGNELHACGCIGPQNGGPVCPCRMRNITIVDGKRALVTYLD